MSLKEIFELCILFFTFAGSFFWARSSFCSSANEMRRKALLEVDEDKTLRDLANEKAGTIVGVILILASIILQVVNSYCRTDAHYPDYFKGRNAYEYTLGVLLFIFIALAFLAHIGSKILAKYFYKLATRKA